jgi:hypothetical protein
MRTMDSKRPIPQALRTSRLAQWTQLRDELAQLNAHLEYLQLMLRLHARRKP